MSAVLMEACSVGCRYAGSRWALRDVCLRLAAGDRLAVLGANGAGKSTLLLALAGILPLAEGRLLWEGRFVSTGKSRSSLRDNVGLLLQDPEDQLFAPTVEQDVAFGLVQRAMPDDAALDRARSVLADLRIAHLAGRLIHHLSLGEKKRVALAGLLALQPRLLLLDEPTAGLDCEGTRSLLDALGRLQAGGMAVVLATHDTNLAAQWADSVAILKEGRFVARGVKQDILSNASVLNGARLSPPLTYAAAAALREHFPCAKGAALPAVILELEQLIHRIADHLPAEGADEAPAIDPDTECRLDAGRDSGAAGH
jgi:cobalt/nickel transport system ATP-binding protein